MDYIFLLRAFCTMILIYGPWSFPTFSFLQVVPHITDAIQEWIERVAIVPVDGKEGPADVCVIELGGTIGRLASLVCNSLSYFPIFNKLKDNFYLCRGHRIYAFYRGTWPILIPCW